MRKFAGVHGRDLAQVLARDHEQLVLGFGDDELLHAVGRLEVVGGDEADNLARFDCAWIPFGEP